jgi:hypothetical protein
MVSARCFGGVGDAGADARINLLPSTGPNFDIVPEFVGVNLEKSLSQPFRDPHPSISGAEEGCGYPQF